MRKELKFNKILIQTIWMSVKILNVGTIKLNDFCSKLIQLFEKLQNADIKK